jgi:cytidylate kinase
VIAIDGPSASGKGTVALLVAENLGFHYLDSGALYRIIALAAKRANIGWQASDKLAEMAKKLHIKFENEKVLLDGDDISEDIRTEEMGRGASEVAVHQPVRAALLDLQHSFRQMPGLVADGRDMASVVFTDARLKIFLTASVEIRAERRYKQLTGKGLSANYDQILADLQQRDSRDKARSASPLTQTEDAILLDTSNKNIEEAVQFVLEAYKNKQ